MCTADDFSRRHFMMHLLGMVRSHSENLGEKSFQYSSEIDTEFLYIHITFFSG